MAAITAYFDASGSPYDTRVVSLSGLVTTAEKWIAFCEEWEGCLDAFSVSALHMKNFAHSQGEFSSWKNDKFKRIRFLNGLMWVIERHVEHTVAATVRGVARDIDPHALGLQVLVNRVHAAFAADAGALVAAEGGDI